MFYDNFELTEILPIITLGVNAFDMEDFFLFKDGAYNSVQAYKNSKAANLMVSYELSRKLADDQIMVNNVNPGFFLFYMFSL